MIITIIIILVHSCMIPCDTTHIQCPLALVHQALFNVVIMRWLYSDLSNGWITN